MKKSEILIIHLAIAVPIIMGAIFVVVFIICGFFPDKAVKHFSPDHQYQLFIAKTTTNDKIFFVTPADDDRCILYCSDKLYPPENSIQIDFSPVCNDVFVDSKDTGTDCYVYQADQKAWKIYGMLRENKKWYLTDYKGDTDYKIPYSSEKIPQRIRSSMDALESN